MGSDQTCFLRPSLISKPGHPRQKQPGGVRKMTDRDCRSKESALGRSDIFVSRLAVKPHRFSIKPHHRLAHPLAGDLDVRTSEFSAACPGSVANIGQKTRLTTPSTKIVFQGQGELARNSFRESQTVTFDGVTWLECPSFY